MNANDELKIRVTSGPNLAIYPPGATFGPRNLRDWEFVWLLEGEATYFWQQGEEQRLNLQIGDVLLCQSGARDRFEWDAHHRTRHGFFHFQIEEIGADWPGVEKWPRLAKSDENSLLSALGRHLLMWSGRETSNQRDLTATLFLSVFLTAQTQIGDAPRQSWPEPVERALKFLNQTLENEAAAPFSLEKMARSAFVTPEHLCRLFRDVLGHSPLETVRLARLDRAALLLARTNFPVAQIGQMCGFGSPFHFSRAFKDAYGVSPRELRNQLGAGQSLPTPRLGRVLKD